MSELMRLRRLSKGAKFKEDMGQLVVPIPRRNPDGTKADAAIFLVSFLRALVEAD
jgi:transcription-repair coupling factor (superfamily II helicase)